METNVEIIQIVITYPDRNSAEWIAGKLVAERIAACAQLSGPITSIYHWEGNLEKSEEWKLSVKTLSQCYEAVKTRVIDNHPYKCPQLIVLPILEGESRYLDWIRQEISVSQCFTARD